MDIEFFSPDLVVYHYPPKVNITWSMLQQIAAETNALIDYKPCYMCSVIGYGVTIEREAREKGTQPEIQKYTKAAAIILNSLAHKIIANFIIRVQRPEVPTRSFTSVEDALSWFKKLRAAERKSKKELIEDH